MSIPISQELFEAAEVAAHDTGRTIAEQIEHWAHIGNAMEKNPDLTYEFFKGIETSLEDIEAGRVESYLFS